MKRKAHQIDYDTFNSKVDLTKISTNEVDPKTAKKKQEVLAKRLKEIDQYDDDLITNREKKKKVMPRCMVSYSKRWRKMWDIMIIIVAVYSGLFTPFQIAFDYQEKKFKDTWWWITLDVVSTIIYIVDIIIAFRSSYLDNFGDEIIDGKKIAAHYIKSNRFWTDVLSLVSNPVVAQFNLTESQNLVVCLFGMLKIIRFLRVRQLITTATLDKGIKAALNFIYLTVLLLFYCHIMGCFWYYVVYYDYCNQNLQID